MKKPVFILPWQEAEAQEIRKWIAAECDPNPLATIRSGDLFRSFEKWSRDRNLSPWSHKKFTTLIHSAGFGSRRSNGKRYFCGIRLKNPPLVKSGEPTL